MGALKDFFSRLAASIKGGGQVREGLFQQRRKRFLSVHNSSAPPPELLVSPPRRLRDVQFLGDAFMVLLCSLYFWVAVVPASQSIVSSFRSIDVREAEAHQWVRKMTAKAPSSEREARYQQVARDVGELETNTAHELRWIMVAVAILVAPVALVTLIGPLLWTRYLLRARHLLRYGVIARAEVISRKPRPSSARLSFVATDGRRVTVIHTVPPHMPVGAKLWVLYSPRDATHTLLYRPDGEIAKLLPRVTAHRL